MRIDAYNQIQQIYGTKRINKAGGQKTTATSFRDQLLLSSAAKDTTIAKQAVAGVPDVREDLVCSLKQQIDDGTYEVDADDFAGRLLEKYSGLF